VLGAIPTTVFLMADIAFGNHRMPDSGVDVHPHAGASASALEPGVVRGVGVCGTGTAVDVRVSCVRRFTGAHCRRDGACFFAFVGG